MKSTMMLRICIVVEWVFALTLYGTSFVLRRLLPDPLQAWVISESERDSSTLEMTLVIGLILLILSALISSVGLFILRRWAAWLYLFTTAAGILLALFFGPSVNHAVTDTLSELGGIMSGMVIALAFLSDALKKRSSE